MIFVAGPDGSVQVPERLTGRKAVIRFLGYQTRGIVLDNRQTVFRLSPDYLLLETITVKAYHQDRRLADVAGSYAFIPGKGLSSQGSSAVVNMVSATPGIRMEQRSPGSYRMNIRGSTLRSPFGVRNVKIYYNEIPVTEPNGNTPLNLLDLEHLSSLSFIRTPAASMYGAGTGGVMLLSSDPLAEEGISGRAELSFGSFGYQQFYAEVQHREGDSYTRVMAGKTGAEGYRDHTRSERRNIGVIGEIPVSEKQVISYTLLYNDIFYELPGGLTSEQRDEDPTQARQIAIVRNSSIDQKYFISGISNKYEWAEGSGNSTSLYYSQANKENPFITNYEFEDLTGYGLRTRFFHTLQAGEAQLDLIAGGEWQWGRFQADNFGNSDGAPDTLRYIDDTDMFTGFEYIQAELKAGKFRITTGASINHLTYDFNRRVDVALDSAYQVKRTFENVITPRIGMVYQVGRTALFANASRGYSPPTQDEVRTSDGAINTGLQAEDAWSVEGGVRSDLLPGRWYGEITMFHILQDNTIVSLVDESGNSLFRNSGTTRQQGIELLLRGKAVDRQTGFLRELNLTGSLSWNSLIFKDYLKEQGGENVDISGNDLTGGVPLTYFLEALVETAGGIRLSLSHQFTDQIPLNDENTVYSKPYHLVRLRVGKEIVFSNGMGLEVYAGGDNLLNETYSLGNDLNAFGNRYFNPSAERNYYAGLMIRF